MMSPARSILAPAIAVCLLLVASCTVGPNFHTPPAPVGNYAAPVAPASHAAPVAVPGEGPDRRWWAAFNSPELDRLVDQAIAHNASLEASNATLAAARERVAAARGQRLPQVDANARVEHEKVNLSAFGLDPDGNGAAFGGNPEFTLYSVGGGVSYDLDLFGGKKRAVELAAARAEAQLRQTEAAHLTLAGQVVNQALLIASIEARIATANALLAEDQRTVDLTNKRKAAGEGTLVEVLNAQSQLEADRTDIPQLRQQLAEARNLLAVLVGVAPSDLGPTDLDIDAIHLPSQVPVAIPSVLVRKRPDIQQAEAQLHAATANVGVATARLYPDITLGATLSQGALDPTQLFSAGTRGFDIFAGLTAPLFHGGTLKAERRAAEDEARAADASYRQTVLDAFRQVSDLLAALSNDGESVATQRQALAVAQHSLRLSRRSFEVGNSGILQVLDSERLYQRAAAQLVEARQRQLVDIGRLFVATAGGWTGPAADPLAAGRTTR